MKHEFESSLPSYFLTLDCFSRNELELSIGKTADLLNDATRSDHRSRLQGTGVLLLAYLGSRDSEIRRFSPKLRSHLKKESRRHWERYRINPRFEQEWADYSRQLKEWEQQVESCHRHNEKLPFWKWFFEEDFKHTGLIPKPVAPSELVDSMSDDSAFERFLVSWPTAHWLNHAGFFPAQIDRVTVARILAGYPCPD